MILPNPILCCSTMTNESSQVKHKVMDTFRILLSRKRLETYRSHVHLHYCGTIGNIVGNWNTDFISPEHIVFVMSGCVSGVHVHTREYI